MEVIEEENKIYPFMKLHPKSFKASTNTIPKNHFHQTLDKKKKKARTTATYPRYTVHCAKREAILIQYLF